MVLFDYDAQHDDELTLRVGQVLNNVRIVDEGWAEGELLGKKGLFPDNFVEMRKATLEDLPPPPVAKEGLGCSLLYTLYTHTHSSHALGQLVVVMTEELYPLQSFDGVSFVYACSIYRVCMQLYRSGFVCVHVCACVCACVCMCIRAGTNVRIFGIFEC